MDRLDAERLAKLETLMEAYWEDMRDLKKSQQEILREIKQATKNHAADHKDLQAKLSTHASQLASIKTKQRIIWTALGGILSAMGFSHLGSLFVK